MKGEKMHFPTDNDLWEDDTDCKICMKNVRDVMMYIDTRLWF